MPKPLTETQEYYLRAAVVERSEGGALIKAGLCRPYGHPPGDGPVLSGLIRRGWLKWRRKNWLETTEAGNAALAAHDAEFGGHAK